MQENTFLSGLIANSLLYINNNQGDFTKIACNIVSWVFLAVTFASLVGTYFMLRRDNKSAFHVWLYTNTLMIILNANDKNWCMVLFFLANMYMAIKGFIDCSAAEKKNGKQK